MHRCSVRSSVRPRSCRASLAAALPLLLACAGGASSDGPSATGPDGPVALPASAPAFPPLAQPGDVYTASDSLYRVSSGYHGGPLASRVVLQGGDRFVMQFVSARWGLYEYGGHVTRTGTGFVFDFTDVSGSGPRRAVGTLRGPLLTVAFEDRPGIADYVDGVYVRTSAAR